MMARPDWSDLPASRHNRYTGFSFSSRLGCSVQIGRPSMLPSAVYPWTATRPAGRRCGYRYTRRLHKNRCSDHEHASIVTVDSRRAVAQSVGRGHGVPSSSSLHQSRSMALHGKDVTSLSASHLTIRLNRSSHTRRTHRCIEEQ